MCDTRRMKLLFVFLVALVFGGVVSGCVPESTEPEVEPTEPEVEPTVPIVEPTVPIVITPLPQPELHPGDPFFAEYRFIVTGSQAEVDDAVNTVTEKMGIPVEPTHSLDLWFLEGLDDCPGLVSFHGAGKLVMVHYIITSTPGAVGFAPQESLAEQVVVGINALPSPVFADLVWGTTSIGERSWHGGESPVEDFYIKFLGDSDSGQKAFCEQWAFTSDEGIRLDTCENPSVNDFTGEGVLTGVFDTMPASVPDTLPLEVERMEELGWLHVDWGTFPSMSSFRDHGLFVSGLINAVAPDSNIVLYPVLYHDGLGDLFTLNYALHSFISDTLRERDTLKGAVINLSLGSPMSVPGDSSEAPLFQQMETPWPLLAKSASLRTLLSAAACQDIVVVAAAGNGGGKSDLPADFPGVIGVMASTVGGEMACYSNEGQIMAPGGGLGGVPLDPKVCLSDMKALYDACRQAHAAEQSEKCGNFLMSLVTEGYAYGAGTSFSAPLVSGLAALILEAGWSPGTLPEGGWIPSGEVLTCITDTTHGDSDRVIDVPAAVREASK